MKEGVILTENAGAMEYWIGAVKRSCSLFRSEMNFAY